MKSIVHLFGITLALVFGPVSLHAQPALVGPEGYTNSFSALPPVTEWSTYAYPGAPANAYNLTNLVQSLASSAISSNLVDASPADPPTQRLLAFWTSGGGGYVCTRPTGDRCTLLMVSLLNQTGSNATSARIQYDLVLKAPQTEPDYPGLRVFYSLSGRSNSWVTIPELSSASPVEGRLTADLSLGAPWMQDNALYVLWVDDNANIAQAEPGYALDNFSVGVTAGVPHSTSLACLVDAPGNNGTVVSGVPITTAATIFQGTPPYTVEYFTNSGAVNTEFVSAGLSGTAPYAVSLGSLPVGTYHIYAVVTDSAPAPASAISTTNTFLVADPIMLTLTAPAQDATFDYLTPVEGSATVSGGTPPYAVQFYVDNQPHGAPVTMEPYTHSFGFLLPGDRAIKATVRDAQGWVSNSLVHTVHVIGPLAVTLTPTNRTTYYYGQSVMLTAAVFYGTAPHTVTFYTNDQLLGSVTSLPFTWNLGVLPVGSYTGRVHVVDSAAPTPGQAESSTNVFTILDNPLLVSLSSPTNGQQVNQGFVVTAVAAVGAPVTISQVEFFLDGVSLGVAGVAPYAVLLGSFSLGSHWIYAVATDSLGRTSTTTTNQVTMVASTGALVGPEGYANGFSTQPPAMEWATQARAGGAGDAYDMDTDVNANITASGVTAQVTASSGNPPGAASTAVWSSGGLYLQTRPTQVRHVALMGKFVNNTGSNAIQIALSYTLMIAEGGMVEEDGKGTRVYYSLTGLPNSWTNLPTLNSMRSVNGTTTLRTNMALNWLNGASLYLLWVDDNTVASGTADAANQIDNFSLRVTEWAPPPLACTLTVPTNNQAFPLGTPIMAAATVVHGTPPYTVEYFTNSGPAGSIFTSMGSSSTAPYNVGLGSPPIGAYRIYAVATDSAGRPASTKSVTNSFFVAEPIGLTLTAPGNDMTFDNTTDVSAAATVSGGTGPYSVQFHLDDLPIGAPATSEPYELNLGPLFVGDHAIKAVVIDARGWIRTSAVHTVHISGPLGVTLSPTNGASYNYGQRVRLTAAPGGGTGPYTVTFYTNDQLVASPSAAPFTVDLGLLPAGSYTGYVHVTDSASPTAGQADSTTNVFSIRPNPLVLTLTSPTNGQYVTAGQPFTVTATAAVGEPVTVTGVEFFMDGVSVGIDRTPPYSASILNVAYGSSHTVYATATDSLGRRVYSGTSWMAAVTTPSVPANDNFNSAFPLSGPYLTATGRNAGGTKEAGEPFIAGNFGGSSIWWTWVASASGQTTIDTYGSSLDTLLGVYTGTAVDQLETVGENDNAPGTVLSQVQFDAVAGTVYHIAVDGRWGSQGNIVLHLRGVGGPSIETPTNGAAFVLGEPIPVTVSISTNFPNPPAQRVDFYANGNLFASATNAPFSTVATNLPLRSNSFFVVAIDSAGEAIRSPVVTVLVQNVGVTLLTPNENTLYWISPITVSAVTYLPSGTITNIEFLVDGRKFGENATSPFSAVWSNAVLGTHRFTAVGRSDTGAQYVSQPVHIGVVGLLIEYGSMWKYLDDGSNQGTNWIAPDFDDRSWRSGPGPLGYGDSGGRLPATINSFGPDSGNKYPTTYYRQAVVLSNVASFNYVYLYVERDDGAVIYLNGVELSRLNMPAGTVTYQTYASATAGDDGTSTYYVPVSPSLLVEGTNVLAVEIHQDSPTSSDIWFQMEMVGYPVIVRNLSPTVALTSPSDGTTALAPASFTLSAEASDPDGTVAKVEFFAGDTKLGESTNRPYALTVTEVPAGRWVLSAVATDDRGAIQRASALVTVYDSSSRWVAFNDHVAGPRSHHNATTWNVFGTEGGAPGDEGPLRNIATGDALSANLTILEFGAFADAVCGAPPPGTPAYNTFNSHVDFGSGDANHAILVNSESLVMHLFTRLDPLRRYSFRGTVVGGVANSSNRWTLFRIVGADAFTTARTANVLTSATLPALAADEAAMNTGDNRSGDVIGWDGIAPGSDGSFVVLSTQYLGPAPGNGRPGPVAYAPVAVRLEEYGAVPLAGIVSPADGYVVEGPTNVAISAFATALDGVSQVQFLGDGAVLGSDFSSPYDIVWNDVPFGSHTLQAVACDAQGICGTSAPVNITITIPPTNTVPPTIFSQTPAAWAAVTNLTSIQVTFSERVIGVDAADLLLNDVPALSVTGSGSNYTFTVAQPPYGVVYVRWAENHGITDVGWPDRLSFDRNDPTALWEYTLIDSTPPFVAAKMPPANSTLTNLTAITVTFSETVAGVNAGDLLINGTPAYELAGSGSNYMFSFAQPASGTVNISWTANHGITDLATTRNPFSAAGSGATWSYTLDARTVIVQSNSMWLFVKGANEPSTPTNAWRLLGFDDSGWSNAPAPFFYGDPYSNGVPAYTHLDDMRSNYTCIYLRKAFVLGNAAAVTNLYLRFQIDDGMAVWINGTEVLRTNVPAGELSYTNTTLTPYGDLNGMPYVTMALPDPRGYLVPGTNVIAVHALNDSLTTSSDFAFNAQLFTYQADTEAVPPRIHEKDPLPGYELFLAAITVTFSEPVTNVDASDLLINGTPATGLASDTNTTCTFSFPQPPYGVVSVTWATNHDIMDLDIEPKPFDSTVANASWQYTLLNPSSPYLLSVTPAQDTIVPNSLTEIAILFSEPVTGVDASDLLINGTPATGLSGTGDSYTFSFPQPPFGVLSVTWATNHGITDLAEPPDAFEPAWPGHTWTYLFVDQIPPTVAAVDPPANAFVMNLTRIAVTFTEPVSGVDASDLLLNGKPASGVVSSNRSYTFTFAQPNASVINVTWATTHGIRDLATTPNAFDATAPGATWSYATVDNLPPSLANVVPAPFSAVRRLRQITLMFDEPVQGVEANSLTINGSAPQEMSGTGAGPYQFSFDQPPTGVVQVALSAAIFDLTSPPNQYRGSNWTVMLDPNLPPATLTRGPYLQLPTTSSMVVRWRTSTNTDSCVWFGLDPGSRTNIVADATLTTEHIITVTNLEPATKYYYAVGTTDGGKVASTDFCFITDPPIGPSRPTRILAITDYGTRDSYERAVRDAYLSFAATNGPADVWLTCGDNDQNDGQDGNYSVSVFGGTYGYASVLQNLALRPAPGNHDYGNSTTTGPYYYANFSMPMNGEAGGVPSGNENYYAYDYANIHFISLDAITRSYSSSTNSAMIQWLYQDLASNTQRWTIAYWHGPPYSRGTHDSDSTSDTLSWMTQMRENVVPALEAYGVDLVLCGHSHVYERSWLLNGHYGYSSTFSETNKIDAGDGRVDGDGTYLKPVGQKTGAVYVTVASGGQPRTGSGPQHPADLMRLEMVLGSCIIDVDSNRLDLRMHGAYWPYTNFQVLDHFTIVKDAPVVPPTAPTDLVAVQNANGVLLSWKNTPTNEMGFRLIRSADGLTWTEITTTGANRTNYTDTTLPSGATGFYRIAAWNGAGNSGYSDVAAVGASGAPIIVEYPESTTVGVGGAATFHVVAAGVGLLSYQWYFNGNGPIPGATNSTLTLSRILIGYAGTYSVVVNNTGGFVTSAEATLAVEGVEMMWLTISQSGGTVTVSWPETPEDWDLEFSAVLSAAGDWHTVSEGIVSDGSTRWHTTTTGSEVRFYRLKRR